jgi:hypothetical protein
MPENNFFNIIKYLAILRMIWSVKLLSIHPLDICFALCTIASSKNTRERYFHLKHFIVLSETEIKYLLPF